MHDNREEIKSLPLIWQQLMRQHDLELECVIPAVVLSYDRTNNLVTCRPAINRKTVEGNSIGRAEIVVPCFNPGGGIVGINFPLKKGNTGWVIASDRDSTSFKDTLGVGDPLTYDLHRYAFGVFLPDHIKGFKIASEDNNAIVIQTIDGSTKIAVADNDIRITAKGTGSTSTTVQITKLGATLSTTGSVTVTALTSGVTVNGNIALNGSLAATGDVTAGTVSLKSHKHLDPQEESVITGRPVQ